MTSRPNLDTLHSGHISIIRGIARDDFRNGCTLSDNPYPVGSRAQEIWQDEMNSLFREEEIQDMQKSMMPAGFM